jgi:hypothetical protein
VLLAYSVNSDHTWFPIKNIVTNYRKKQMYTYHSRLTWTKSEATWKSGVPFLLCIVTNNHSLMWIKSSFNERWKNRTKTQTTYLKINKTICYCYMKNLSKKNLKKTNARHNLHVRMHNIWKSYAAEPAH